MMPAPIRGSDVHLSEDVRRMLRSLAAAHESAQQISGVQSDYQAGYSAGFLVGLCAVAEALGIPFQVGVGNVALGYRWEG